MSRVPIVAALAVTTLAITACNGAAMADTDRTEVLLSVRVLGPGPVVEQADCASAAETVTFDAARLDENGPPEGVDPSVAEVEAVQVVPTRAVVVDGACEVDASARLPAGRWLVGASNGPGSGDGSWSADCEIFLAADEHAAHAPFVGFTVAGGRPIPSCAHDPGDGQRAYPDPTGPVVSR